MTAPALSRPDPRIRPGAEDLPEGHHLLQALLWPEPGISTEPELYLRTSGAAGFSIAQRSLRFSPGGQASFDTAFNLFNLGKWQHGAGLSDLSLWLDGSGRFELSVTQMALRRSDERVVNELIDLQPGQPLQIPLGPVLRKELGGVLVFSLRALEDGTLTEARWTTMQAPRRHPQIALSITTFRREEAVRASVRRFERFAAGSPLAAFLHLQVVDNGKSAGIPDSDHVTALPNENLGGSGGFARGLIEAEARGASHVLFMDDDASVHMDALQRVWSWLAHASAENAAVAGALTNARRKYEVVDNGATFHLRYRPGHIGTDLRDLDEVARMEFETTGPVPGNFYGGWWFFAFPVAAVRFRPFPYFVRGDDVGFSIANNFSTVTLPGVVSFQDVNFADKQGATTLYLDLRSHMGNHLAIPRLQISRLRMVLIPLRFAALSTLQCHYETVAALNLAVEDVLRGPDFFAANADMAARRADLAALLDDEAFRPGPVPSERIRFRPGNPLLRFLMKVTLNGHLIPFFRRIGNRRVLAAGRRGDIRQTWAAAQITYVDEQGNVSTVRHSKRRAARQIWRLSGNLWRLWRDHDRLRDAWRSGYTRLASDAFWRGRLGLDTASGIADATKPEADADRAAASSATEGRQG